MLRSHGGVIIPLGDQRGHVVKGASMKKEKERSTERQNTRTQFQWGPGQTLSPSNIVLPSYSGFS